MLSEDILFLPVAELSRRVRARQLSPVQLTESYLDRSRTIGKKLNAYATLTPDLALKQAHAAEKEIAAGSALTMTPLSSRSWKLPAPCCWARQP